jgi:ribosomal-protein-alanine N-acetyltransferase
VNVRPGVSNDASRFADSLRIRPAALRDLESIVRIERLSAPAPWSPRRFEAELGLPQARVRVAGDEDGLFGFLVAWRVEDELDIHNLAVHPDFRRRGIAARLLGGIIREEGGSGARRFYLEVREGNAPAIALYRKTGFAPVRVRPGYYENGENALCLRLEL